MALALGLPLTLQGRSQVITLVFSTVLVSLIGQGLSLPWFVKKLQLAKPSPVRQRLENLQLNLVAAKSAQEELKSLLQSGSLPKFLYEELFASYQARIANAEEELRGLYNQRLSQKLSQFDNQTYLEGVRHRLFLAEKSAINEAILKGLITDEIARPYLQELNQKILGLRDS